MPLNYSRRSAADKIKRRQILRAAAMTARLFPLMMIRSPWSDILSPPGLWHLIQQAPHSHQWLIIHRVVLQIMATVNILVLICWLHLPCAAPAYTPLCVMILYLLQVLNFRNSSSSSRAPADERDEDTILYS